MSMIQHKLSPRAREVQRLNALKSTGPRTPAGKRRSAANSRQPGVMPDRLACSSRPPEENRDGFQLLVAELSEAYQPANPAERLLVEDLAMLRLRQRRNQAAQDGLILKNLGRLERLRDERRQEAVMESPEYPFVAAHAIGLINMEDSPAKFKEVGRLLRIMLDDVEVGNFSDAGRQILNSIYGPAPTMRGARALGNYIRILASGIRPAPTALMAGGESSTLRFEDDGLQAAYSDLLRALAEEKDLLGGKYRRFLAEHIPSDAVLRQSAMVPPEQEWPLLARQESQIDRQIETKTRLLLFTQWVRRSNEARAPYIGNETKPISC